MTMTTAVFTPRMADAVEARATFLRNTTPETADAYEAATDAMTPDEFRIVLAYWNFGVFVRSFAKYATQKQEA